MYGAGYEYSDYNDSTIYNKLHDRLFLHQIQIALQIQQKWGSANLSLEGSNYFHDFSKNRIELEGSVRVRIIKGLSLQVRGGVGLTYTFGSISNNIVNPGLGNGGGYRRRR